MLDIYIGNLPDRASMTELRDLYIDIVGQNPSGSVLDSLRGNFSSAHLGGELEFTMVKAQREQHARYCLISGHSLSTAKKIIGLLSGVGLHGHVLKVRPFYSRERINDQRRAGWHFRRWLGVERRASDRRIRR